MNTEVEFRIDCTFTAGSRAYVVVHRISGGGFTLSENSALGGIPIEAWLEQPRALAPDGTQDPNIFAFALKDSADTEKLIPGALAKLIVRID